MNWNKYKEYIERGLPHVGKDGKPCVCKECQEAREMGLGQVKAEYEGMLLAQADWKPNAFCLACSATVSTGKHKDKRNS